MYQRRPSLITGFVWLIHMLIHVYSLFALFKTYGYIDSVNIVLHEASSIRMVMTNWGSRVTQKPRPGSR